MSTPAGWYDDGSGRQRWWDGQQWTEHFAPDAQTDAGQADAAGEAPAAAAGDHDPDATVLREETPSAPSQDENPTQAYPPSDYVAPGYAPPAAPGVADVSATAAYPGAYQAPGAAPYGGARYGAYPPAEPTGPKKTPVLGFIGFGLAVLGTILACIPITFVFGAIVLFAAFVVSLIAIFQKSTKKWPSITGLILSVVGGIVGTIIFVITVLAVANDFVTSLPSSSPYSDSESSSPEESEAPSDGSSAEGRPSADEVAVGFKEIIATMGMTDELSDDQIACYAEYFVASDIPDDTLWVIASGDETLSDMDAATEFTEKLTDGMSSCLIP